MSAPISALTLVDMDTHLCDYDCDRPAVGYAETSQGALLARYCRAHADQAYDEFAGDDTEFRPLKATP